MAEIKVGQRFKKASGPSNVWESDYFLFVRHEGGIRTYDMKYKVAKNDKSFHVVAYYNE